MTEIDGSNIYQILSRILKLEAVMLETIDEECSLKEYGLDSLKAIELIAYLEHSYKIIFDYEDISTDNFSTIRRIKKSLAAYMRVNTGL